MTPWDELLRRLADVPRENGTAALQQTASYLVAVLEGAGLDVELVPFTAHPYRLRLAGVVALGVGLLYFRLMRQGRSRPALAFALLVPLLLLAELDFYLPTFGWIGAQTQHHVVARVPAEDPVQTLVFAAHYDTKTDLLDHVERAPVDFLALLVVPVMILGALAAGFQPAQARRTQRLLGAIGRAAAWVALSYGVAAFTALSAGAFVPARSPGALDDGAACALLVRLAEALAEDGPLTRTDVEIWLLSAEEVGVQGSWAYATRRFAAPPAKPLAVINLEGIGASTEHVVLRRERFTLRSYAPDPGLRALLDSVHERLFAAHLGVTPVGGATDARSFLAHGIPALTVMSREPGRLFPRGLHSAQDDRSRLDPAALDASAAFFLAVAREVDARGS